MARSPIPIHKRLAMFKAFWSALVHCRVIFQEEYGRSQEAKIVKVISAIIAGLSLFIVVPGNPIPSWRWPWRIAAASFGLLFLSVAMLTAVYRRYVRSLPPIRKKLLTSGCPILRAEQDSDKIFQPKTDGSIQVATIKVMNTLYDKTVPVQDETSIKALLFYREFDGEDHHDSTRAAWMETDHYYLDFYVGKPEYLIVAFKRPDSKSYFVETYYDEPLSMKGEIYSPEYKQLTGDLYHVTVQLVQHNELVGQFNCRLVLNPYFGISFTKRDNLIEN